MTNQTPICDFGQKALPFELKSTENKIISLNDIKGENGTLIMFICNHCPYVKAVTREIIEDCNELKKVGINSVAICSNDFVNYPDDSFDNMIKFSKDNNFNFPYLNDETQNIDRAKIIEDNKKVIIKECETSDDIECRVRSFFSGETYKLEKDSIAV